MIPMHFLLADGIFLLSGFLQGLIGFGAAMIAMPLLALIMNTKTAVAACNLCCIGMNILMCYTLRGQVDRRKILPLIVGSIPGVAVGTATLQMVDEQMITLMLGGLVVAYALYSLLIKPVVLRISPNWGFLAGLLTGYVGSVTSAGGPPSAVYTSLMGWEKDELKGTLSAFFLFAGVTVAAGHFICGLTTPEVLGLSGEALPFILLGAYWGNLYANRVNEASYRKAVLVILVLMGLALVHNGMRSALS